MGVSLKITNVKALQAFQLMRQGSIILTGILLANSTIGIQAIGQFELLLFIGTTISLFWVSSFLHALLPLYPKLSFEKQRDLIFNAYLIFLAAGIFLFLLFLLAKPILLPLLTGQEDIPFFWLYLCFFIINLPSYLIEYIYLLDNRPKHIFSFGVLSFGLQFLVIVLPVYLGYGLGPGFQGLLALGIIKHLWTLRLVFRKGQPSVDLELMRPYWKLSIPLMGVAILGSFTLFFDNWLVGSVFKSEATFAIFRYGARELPLVTALSMAFGAALIPEIAKSQDFALAQIKQKSAYLMHLLFPISALLMITSYWWFPKVFSHEFMDSITIFNVYLLLIISRLVFPNSILVGKKWTNIQFWATAAGLGMNVMLSWWWVHSIGLLGIAYATIVAFFGEKLIMIIALQWKGIKFNSYIPCLTWSLYSAALLLLFYFVG